MKNELAKIQRKALRYIQTQQNPATPLKFRGQTMLGLSTEKGMIPISRQVGPSGAWSKAYLSFVDEQPTVFIETSVGLDDSIDLSKDILVAINEQGTYPHIPIIEYFGTGQNGTKIYKMPLYNTEAEWELIARYEDVIKILRQATDEWYMVMPNQEREVYASGGVWDDETMNKLKRKYFIKYLERHESYFLSQKDNETLVSIIQDLKVMNEFLNDNDLSYYFEFPIRNLALDGNKQLILLDVLYPEQW